MPRHQIRAFSSRNHPLGGLLRLPVILLLAGGLILTGCSKKESELRGFYKYEIGKSTPADGYSCFPDKEQTKCVLNPSSTIAGHKTQTDLYFRGHAEDAPLVEIAVGIWACQPGKVSAELQGKLGEPVETADRRLLWKLKHMTVIALLPRSDNKELCMVHFVDPTETAQIAALFADEAPAPQEKPAAEKPAVEKPAVDAAPAK